MTATWEVFVKIFLRLILALTFAFTPSLDGYSYGFAAEREEEDCDPPSSSLVQSLYDWIGANTDYSVAEAKAHPAKIIVCRRGDVVPFGSETLLIEPMQKGIFDFETRTVYLVLPWRQSEIRDVGVLLHELVHDIQFLNQDWPCPTSTEVEAYQLQEKWLAENDVEIKLNWLLIYHWARCPRESRP